MRYRRITTIFGKLTDGLDTLDKIATTRLDQAKAATTRRKPR